MAALAEAKSFLEHERKIVESIGDVQAELEMYREKGKSANRKELLAEERHPSDVLEKHMRAVPVPKPSANHTARHIAPGKGKTKFANRARVRIHLFKVRINDPDNGVWLPRYAKHTPHRSMPAAKGHMEYHTEGYEKWVATKLQAKSSELLIRQQLQLIGTALQHSNLPPEARSKKSQAKEK